jgi:hypothetical protein
MFLKSSIKPGLVPHIFFFHTSIQIYAPLIQSVRFESVFILLIILPTIFLIMTNYLSLYNIAIVAVICLGGFSYGFGFAFSLPA